MAAQIFSIADIREFRRENRAKADEHARANAAQAAVLLENDRRLTRMSEIEELLDIYTRQKEDAENAIHSLATEYDTLRRATR